MREHSLDDLLDNIAIDMIDISIGDKVSILGLHGTCMSTKDLEGNTCPNCIAYYMDMCNHLACTYEERSDGEDTYFKETK